VVAGVAAAGAAVLLLLVPAAVWARFRARQRREARRLPLRIKSSQTGGAYSPSTPNRSPEGAPRDGGPSVGLPTGLGRQSPRLGVESMAMFRSARAPAVSGVVRRDNPVRAGVEGARELVLRPRRRSLHRPGDPNARALRTQRVMQRNGSPGRVGPASNVSGGDAFVGSTSVASVGGLDVTNVAAC
jgi:hypothetical protein